MVNSQPMNQMTPATALAGAPPPLDFLSSAIFVSF
jgi:hypothetical protein